MNSLFQRRVQLDKYSEYVQEKDGVLLSCRAQSEAGNY